MKKKGKREEREREPLTQDVWAFLAAGRNSCWAEEAGDPSDDDILNASPTMLCNSSACGRKNNMKKRNLAKKKSNKETLNSAQTSVDLLLRTTKPHTLFFNSFKNSKEKNWTHVR